MFQGITVNTDTIALDAIRETGPGGNYLRQRHTRQYMRQRWQPSLMDRRTYEAWQTQKDGAREWARQKARQILQEYHPEPLAESLQAEIRKIIAQVETTA